MMAFFKKLKLLLLHYLYLMISKASPFPRLATRNYGLAVSRICEVRWGDRKNQKYPVALISMQKSMKPKDRKYFLNLQHTALSVIKAKSTYGKIQLGMCRNLS